MAYYPICVLDYPRSLMKFKMYVAGWGKTGMFDTGSKVLKHAAVKVRKPEECSESTHTGISGPDSRYAPAAWITGAPATATPAVH